MTELAGLDEPCRACKKDLRDDEGVGVSHKGEIVWLHSSCLRKVRQRKAMKRRQRKMEKAREPRRGSRRVGALS